MLTLDPHAAAPGDPDEGLHARGLGRDVCVSRPVRLGFGLRDVLTRMEDVQARYWAERIGSTGRCSRAVGTA